MTIKQKLILMDEIEEHNDSMIRLFLSREPIRKRTDPRYRAKMAVKESADIIIKAIPEFAGLTLVTVLMLVVVPAVFSMIGG